MIVAIHQPNYLPWIGYFHKIASCDHFIVLDDVQYVRRGFVNRNRIKTPRGVEWLTVPVQVKGNYEAEINEIVPCWADGWDRTHRRTLETNYGRTPHFEDVMANVISPVLTEAAGARWSLASLNVALVRRICEYLAIRTPMSLAGGYGVCDTSTRRLAELVRAAGGSVYLSGRGGDKYQEPVVFEAAGVELRHAEFAHPEYPQMWGPFEPNLSVIDWLFNCGRIAAGSILAAANARAAVVSTCIPAVAGV